MDKVKLGRAILEAKRFLKKANEVLARDIAEESNKWKPWGTKENAACKRASMDLSRTLSELRKGR